MTSIFSLVAFGVCFLAHHSDSFVGGFDGYRFDVTDWDTVNSLRLGLFGAFSVQVSFTLLEGFLRKVPGSASILETALVSLCLSHVHMLLHDVLSIKQLSSFVWNALQLVVFDFTSNGCLCIVRLGLGFILHDLNLNLLRLVINTSNNINESEEIQATRFDTYLRPVRIS